MVIKALWKWLFGNNVNPLYVRALDNAIMECEHNASPGVGNAECPFHLTHIRELANFKEIIYDANTILDLYYKAVRCNANLKGSSPGMLKNQFEALKNMLSSEKKRIQED
jgi:hypothetical protein